MKSRHTFIALSAVTAAMAVTAALATGAGPALARSAPSRAAGRCAASQLSMTVPSAIAGDPADGMGKLAWNILLRNTGKAGCSLAGWPGLTIRTGAKAVAITSADVSYSNLAEIRAQAFTLAAGQQAVVTVQTGDDTAGCRAAWKLTLRLPGGGGALTSAQRASFYGPCGGGLLRLSPFYPRSALTSAIRKLQVAQSPPVYPAISAPAPAACTAQRMRVAASYGSAAQDGSVQVLRLVGRGSGACALAGGWPAVVLHGSDGATQIAKALPLVPRGVTRSSLVSYQQVHGLGTDVTLRGGTPASIALVTQTSGKACHVATSATLYPGVTDAGPGLTVHLARPARFCGLPRVLPYLAGQPSVRALMPAARVLVRGGVTPDGDSPAGFWYGSDSNAPVPTASSGGIYLMPHSPTGGPYGGYVGEVGAYAKSEGCTTSGLNWNQTGYNDAQSNLVNHTVGVGTAGYFMMAGPGREPGGYVTNSTAATAATNWGTTQAQQAVAGTTHTLGLPVIFMDIENVDHNGWNNGFSSVCGSTETAGSIPSAIDRDTFNGFWNYINNSTIYFPAVYDAGGSGGNTWNNVFGSSQTLGDTMEWTYVNETTSLSTFPTGFAVGSTHPVWFASAPTQCQMMWQWSGGNGQTNGVGDFDQIDGNVAIGCA